MTARRRVLVLGGGAGGLSAAWALSSPELEERYDVTVLQTGWRLGGKGASGRDPRTAERIEEHGLHVWFGFYENAFSLMRDCYDELGRPPGSPIRTWRDAFEPCDDVVLLSRTSEGWCPRTWHFPPNDGVPGDPADESLLMLADRALDWLRAGGLRAAEEALPREHAEALARAHDLVRAPLAAGDPVPESHQVGFARQALDALGDVLLSLRHPREARSLWREYAMTLDLGGAIVRGILADDLLGLGCGAIDGEEFTDWLSRHGLNRRTRAESPLLRGFYQLCFAYAGGDRDRPSVAAGKALQAFIRIILTYQGSIVYKMRAGMGDTIFAPLYEVLRGRGVDFEFFTNVRRLGVAPGGDAVDSVELVRQVEPAGAPYEPLVDVGGLPCWPNEPRWEQLADGAALRASGVDFERQANPLGAAARLLRRGDDFDDIVLAIPVGGLPELAADLAAAHEGFRAMLEAASTVGTQALQVWLRADADALGLHHRRDMLSGAYAAPLDTYADMSHLLPREEWPAEDVVRHIAYFCGVMRDEDAEDQVRADRRAREDGLTHLRTRCQALWPGVTADGAFDFDLLVDPADRAGEERYEAQFWRANVTGSERYVLTPPGSVERRLRPDESGFVNVALAGDWTRNGICGGSVEAAVTSGLLAARALAGEPVEVPGVRGWLRDD